MGTNQWRRAVVVVVGLVLVLGAMPLMADAIYIVTLNTAPLQATAGTYSLYFQLTDGSATNDGNNTATLSSFAFGTGGATGTATLAGGASGDLGSVVSLIDTAFFNGFVQGFTPGGILSFTLDLTNHLDAGGVPDLFAMSILDANGIEIPTLDPSGANTLFTITIDSPLQIQTWGSDATIATSTGDFITMSAPVLIQATPVPEPTTLLLLATGAVGILKVIRRRT